MTVELTWDPVMEQPIGTGFAGGHHVASGPKTRPTLSQIRQRHEEFRINVWQRSRSLRSECCVSERHFFPFSSPGPNETELSQSAR